MLSPQCGSMPISNQPTRPAVCSAAAQHLIDTGKLKAANSADSCLSFVKATA